MAGIGEITIPAHIELSEQTKEMIRTEARRIVIDVFARLIATHNGSDDITDVLEMVQDAIEALAREKY